GDERSFNDTLTTSIVHYSLGQRGVSPGATICNGVSVNISAYGGVSYQWNNGSSTALINVSPVVSTTYQVQITDTNGCVTTDSVRINVLPSLNVPEISATNNEGCY